MLGDEGGGAVSLNEIFVYTYFNTLMSIDRTNGSIKEIRGFRYKSKTEATLWDTYLNNALPSHSLIFYGFLEELRFLENENKNPTTAEEILQYNLGIMIISSIAIYGLNGKRLRSKLKELGDGGKALNRLIEECEVFIAMGREDVLWSNNSEDDIYSKIHELMYLFSSSSFVGKQKVFFDNVKKILWDIKAQEYLDEFFSPFKEVKKKIVGHVRGEDESLRVIFFKGRPVWAKENGENSFFSAVFDKYIRKEDREFVLFLEKLRVFLMADKETRREAREESVLLMAEKLIIRGRGGVVDEKTKEEYGEFAAALFKATSKAEIIDNFAKATNEMAISFSKKDIEAIVKNEAIATYTEMENMKNPTPEKEEDLKNLFFVNIIEEITELYTNTHPLLYRDFSEKDMAEMAKMISENIEAPMKDGKEGREWL